MFELLFFHIDILFKNHDKQGNRGKKALLGKDERIDKI